jgi:hypothetical protein
MAITRAQQFKQLVNPPMEGKKRPGYRGDDAARSSEGTSAGRADPGGAGRGDTRGDPGPVERDTGLERARQRNIALDKQLLDTPFKGFNTPFASINFLGNTLGKFGYEKTTKFFSNNSIGGKINPATGEPFGYGPQGYKDYMDQRTVGNVNAFGNPTTQYDDQDDNDAYIFPTSGIMAEAPSDMDPESEIDEDEGLSRRFRAEGGIMNTDVVGGEMDFESARQMYGLGKLVKKVTRSVKKIAKSPIGKAAIVGGLGYLTMGGSGGISKFFGKGSFNPFKTLIPGVGKVSSPFGALASKFGITDLVTGSLTGPGKAVLGLGIPAALSGLLTAEQEEEAQMISDNTGIDIAEIRANPDKYLGRRFRAEGGSMDEPVAKKTMPLLDMGGKEMDLRAEGGFVPIGRMEKADDVPARLSKNEFVFTAEAVRNAGEGDVDKGAEVMYNMMKNLESGGDVSEESQGLEGARDMFKTSQRLEEVL